MTAASTQNLDPKTEMVKERTDWSAVNTRFASERTLMAVVRTSLSLISFGFTIYKVFEALRHAMEGPRVLPEHAPQRLGLTLVTIGIVILVAGSYQHWFFMKELRKETNQKFPRSVSLLTAILLGLTGMVLFMMILAHL